MLYDVTVTATFVYKAVEADTEELAIELVRSYADDELDDVRDKPELEFNAVERR